MSHRQRFLKTGVHGSDAVQMTSEIFQRYITFDLVIPILWTYSQKTVTEVARCLCTDVCVVYSMRAKLRRPQCAAVEASLINTILPDWEVFGRLSEA